MLRRFAHTLCIGVPQRSVLIRQARLFATAKPAPEDVNRRGKGSYEPPPLPWTYRDESKEDNKDQYYPMLRDINITTKGRMHSVDASCDKIIGLINLGAINVHLATQYCHYLVDISRSSSGKDHEYYQRICFELMQILMKKNNLGAPCADLVTRVASSSAKNCALVCDQYILARQQPAKLSPIQLTKLLTICYNFELWNHANDLVSLGRKQCILEGQVFDALTHGLSKANERLTEKPDDELRNQLINHVMLIVESLGQNHSYAVFKNLSPLVKELESLNVKVVTDPNIKYQGRCTNCGANLPNYPDHETKELNNVLRDVIHQGTDTLRFHFAKNDFLKFENELENMFVKDKRPIDCVIDGLNLAHLTSQGFKVVKKQITEDMVQTQKFITTRGQQQSLVNLIIRNGMLQRYSKILLIGKQHMANWPGLMEFLRENNIYHYFSMNHTKDDLFQLYASTLSPRTILITNDYLRDHFALIPSEHRSKFLKWIETHQTFINRNNLGALWPTNYRKVGSVSPDRNRFHLPMFDANITTSGENNQPPPYINNKAIRWICCETPGETVNK